MQQFGKAAALAALTAVLLMSLGPLARGAEPATAVAEEQGTTSLLGGGDHRFIRFGRDAAFGVLWGTNASPNYVYLVAIKARYLGVADVKTDDGTVVENDRPMKIYTIYAVKLESFIEFNDTNGDGIASYTRAHNTLNYTSYMQTEPLLKRVTLRQAWEASPVTRTTSGTTRTWSFALTARNLTYEPLAGTASGVLDEVTFTFHLTTTTVRVDNATVPQYAVTVSRVASRWAITNVTRDGTTTWTGDRFQYRVKWDQRVVGWDFDPTNANPGLVLELGAIIANRIPTDAAGWFGVVALWRLNEGGAIRWRDQSGSGNASENTTYLSNRKLSDPSIEAGGDWSPIGRLTWVSNATVDGNPGLVYAQVQGGIFGLVATGTHVYVGFAILVGLSFPAGQVIVHDPLVDAEAFEIVVAASTIGGGLLLLAVAFAAVAVVVASVVIGRRYQRATTLNPPAPDGSSMEAQTGDQVVREVPPSAWSNDPRRGKR